MSRRTEYGLIVCLIGLGLLILIARWYSWYFNLRYVLPAIWGGY